MKLFSFLTILLLSSALFGQSNSSETLVIQNVHVVDLDRDSIVAFQDVVIKGTKIQSITPSGQEQTQGQRINGSGKYLIPGLWDMHAHYNWNYTYSSPLLVANGVTGVREMWGVPENVHRIRDHTQKGVLTAPEVWSAGSIIDGKPPIWPGSSGVANAEEAVEEVKKQAEKGVDFFKVYSRLSREAYFAIAETAAELGMPFSGHVPESITIWEAIESRQHSLEHLYGILEACSANQERLKEFPSFSSNKMIFLVQTFDQNKFDSLATVLGNSTTWICPTLTVLESIANLDDPSNKEDERLLYMPPSLRTSWDPDNDFRFKNSGPAYFEANRSKLRLQLKLLPQLEEAGVRILAGTDYPNPYCYPGFSLHDELGLMVKAGLSSSRALQTATIEAARFMGREKEIGLVKKGYTADLVLLEANPLEDISNTKRINSVFLKGKFFGPKDLDRLLEMGRQIAEKQ